MLAKFVRWNNFAVITTASDSICKDTKRYEKIQWSMSPSEKHLYFSSLPLTAEPILPSIFTAQNCKKIKGFDEKGIKL